MAKQPLPDPPNPAPTSLSKADCNSFWTPENRNCTSLFPDPTNLKFWTKNRKLEETGEKKEKRWLFDLSLLQLCWKKKTSITSMDPCSCFHGFLHLWELPCFVSQTRSYCPLWTRHPRDLPQLGFPSIVVVPPFYLYSKNKQILYLSFVLIKQA